MVPRGTQPRSGALAQGQTGACCMLSPSPQPSATGDSPYPRLTSAAGTATACAAAVPLSGSSCAARPASAGVARTRAAPQRRRGWPRRRGTPARRRRRQPAAAPPPRRPAQPRRQLPLQPRSGAAATRPARPACAARSLARGTLPRVALHNVAQCLFAACRVQPAKAACIALLRAPGLLCPRWGANAWLL